MYQVMYKNYFLAKTVKVAKNFFSRLKGLMWLDDMKGFDGLLIKRCNSIHTCFMYFNLDVIFLNDDYKIIKIIRNIVPWRITWIYFKATQVLEVQAGKVPEEIREGEYLVFKEVVCIN